MNTKTTAILIFANSAQQESVSKPFRSSARLFGALNGQTLKTVEKTGLPYFHFSEKEQKGATFGERYVHAIQTVYDQGYENVITVGNDTPHLQTSQLLQTAKKLKENPIVLGPSRDGGFYLMGLHKSQFNAKNFLKLPWQTSKLTQSISRLVSVKKIKVVFLKVLRDIDSVSDLQKISNSFHTVSRSIRKIIRSIISLGTVQILQKNNFYSSFLKEFTFNKGSPLFYNT